MAVASFLSRAGIGFGAMKSTATTKILAVREMFKGVGLRGRIYEMLMAPPGVRQPKWWVATGFGGIGIFPIKEIYDTKILKKPQVGFLDIFILLNEVNCKLVKLDRRSEAREKRSVAKAKAKAAVDEAVAKAAADEATETKAMSSWKRRFWG